MKRDVNHKKQNMSKSFKYILLGMGTMIVVSIITAIVFGFYLKSINQFEIGSGEVYEKHYAFVVEDNDSEFWDQVYLSASEQARQDGIYLENIKESLKVNYSNEDLLRVAINSSVDGIIYAGSSSKEAIKLINKAVDNGIGVVVLHNDIDMSKRQCFVGLNNYELGQMYAYQIIKMSNGKSLKGTQIAILASGDMSEGAANLIVLGIEDSFDTNVEEEERPEIEIIRINAEDTFSVEEDIRNIFVSQENLPNILLCLEGAYTQCVYQAVVDYNRVGEVQIIGYYSNNDILEAIDKDIIYSTISVDTDEMGQSAILAIEELNEMGYTNSFMPVTMEVIGKEEAKEILSEEAEMDGDK